MDDDDQCDFEALTDMLESDMKDDSNSDQKNEGKKESNLDKSSDDDIDDDELDKLAALLAEDDDSEKVAGDSQNSESTPDKVVQSEATNTAPVFLKTESKKSTEQTINPPAAATVGQDELRQMQERIKQLETMLLSQASPAASTTKEPSPARPPPTNRKSPSSTKSATTVRRELKPLEKDIFSSNSQNYPPRKNSTPPRATTQKERRHSGKIQEKKQQKQTNNQDSDSDWEDMEGNKDNGLSDAGSQMNKLLKKSAGRVAHSPSFDPTSLSQYRKDDGESSQKKESKGTANSFYNNSDKKNSYESKASTSERHELGTYGIVKEPFSGIRIINPQISASQMKSRMEGKKMIPLSRLHQRLKTAESDADWVTIGVLVSKSEPRVSSKGKQYSIWKLNDLEDCEQLVSFFLFNEIFRQHWKTTVGSVIGLLNPSIMQNTEKYQSKSNEVTLTLDHCNKLMMMGKSKDLGVCHAKTKGGKNCQGYINVQQGTLCTYHVQAAYKKMGNKRSELQASYQGSRPKSFEKKVFTKTGSSYTYQGQEFCTGPVAKRQKTNQVTIKGLQSHHAKTASAQPKINTLGLHDILPEDKKSLHQVEEKKNKEFHQLLSLPTPGSMQFVKHLKNQDEKPNYSKEKNGEPQKRSVNVSDVLKEFKREMSSKKKERAVEPPRVSDGLPQLGRGFSQGQDVFLDFSPAARTPDTMSERRKLAEKQKAIALVKNKGGVKKSNPNAVRSERSPESQKKLKRKLKETSPTVEEDESERSEQSRIKSRLLGNLDLESPEVQEMLKSKSAHESILNDEELEKQEQYFNILEKKENMEAKMDSIREIKCFMITCKQCKYTAPSAKSTCKEQGHKLVRSETKKRFFKCVECKYRTTSIERYPTERCRGCGGAKFERVSMLKEQKGPKLEQEEFKEKPYGDAPKYIHF